MRALLFIGLASGIIATTFLSISAFSSGNNAMGVGILALGLSNEIAILGLIVTDN